MQSDHRPLLDFDPTLDPATPIECLGEVTIPSGIVLVIDTGQLDFWSHDRAPILEEGTMEDQRIEEIINSCVDLKIVGADAIAAGQTFHRQWDPRFLYDIPANGIEKMRGLFSECLQGKQLDAAIQEMPARVSHRQRVDLALEWGKGQGEIQYHGVPAIVANGLPQNQAMKVYGVRMNEPRHRYRWRWVWLEVQSGSPTTKSEEVGVVGVDRARLMFTDVDALGQWEHEMPLDEQADYVFWGRDAAVVAKTTRAPKQAEGYGWIDLSVEEAVERGTKVEEYCEKHGLRIAADFRPHSHHYEVMKQVRATPTESGVIEVGGAKMCVFMTSWGDGIFPVFADRDQTGQLLRLRIDLGNEQQVQILDSLN
ncbi:MAG: hypothetical protein JST84_15020 [Acidobacteria bacterium]|nr:hypothetical protein [Acidobacteriota bacterium]